MSSTAEAVTVPASAELGRYHANLIAAGIPPELADKIVMDAAVRLHDGSLALQHYPLI